MTRTNLGAALAAFRASKRMGVRECARLMKLSYATLNRIERGGMMKPAHLLLILSWFLQEERTAARKQP